MVREGVDSDRDSQDTRTSTQDITTWSAAFLWATQEHIRKEVEDPDSFFEDGSTDYPCHICNGVAAL
jgi:hypothetical protein